MQPVQSTKSRQTFLCGFLCRRECVLPTWRAWLLVLLLCAAGLIPALRGAYSFLAISDPVPGGLLVVEGWGNDAFLSASIEEFRKNHYDGLFVTGGPIDKGLFFTEHKSYADISAETLEKMGFDPKFLHAVPAQAVRQDRTYASAMALKTWMREHGLTADKINVMTMGEHARRTRLLFEKAFGKGVRVGIMSVDEETFDPQEWWRSSQGFRTVTGEIIAYFYARFLFHAHAE